MSEVVKLQLIGLCVVGFGTIILLFIKSQFARVIGFVSIVLGLFALVALAVPQMASLPPAEESINIADIKTPTDMATIGQRYFSVRANVPSATRSVLANQPVVPT